MPKAENIHQMVKDGKFSAITLDTCSFDELHCRLENYPLKALRLFNRLGVQVILPEIIVEEVFSHMLSTSKDAHEKLKIAINSIRKHWQIEDEVCSKFMQEIDEPDAQTHRRLVAFKNSLKAKILEIKDYVSAEDIFKKYFDVELPFESKKDKKSEFPDAAALLSLEKWTLDTDKNMLVITSDKGWIQFCEKSKHLFHIKNIREALKLFQDDAVFICEQISAEICDGDPQEIINYVADKIKEEIDKTGFSVDVTSSYECECDVEYVELDELELPYNRHFLFPLEYSGDTLKAEFLGEASVHIGVGIELFVWDSVDREYIKIGEKTRRFQDYLSCSIALSFEKQGHDWILVDHEAINVPDTIELDADENDEDTEPDI